MQIAISEVAEPGNARSGHAALQQVLYLPDEGRHASGRQGDVVLDTGSVQPLNFRVALAKSPQTLRSEISTSTSIGWRVLNGQRCVGKWRASKGTQTADINLKVVRPVPKASRDWAKKVTASSSDFRAIMDVTVVLGGMALTLTPNRDHAS
jgi:hypothetical protein